MNFMTRRVLAVLLMSAVGTATAAHPEEEYLVVGPGEVGDYWNFTNMMPYPDFPKSAMRKHMNTCIAVGFSIESDGTPSNVTVLRVETSKPRDMDETERIKSAMTEAIRNWRFEPAENNAARRPLYTYTVMSMAFSVPGTLSKVAQKHSDSVAQSCEITGFIDTVLRGEIGPLRVLKK
jgi:hypothetical protein